MASGDHEGQQLDPFGPPPTPAQGLKLFDVYDPAFMLGVEHDVTGGATVLAVILNPDDALNPRQVIGIDLNSDQVLQLVEYLRRDRKRDEDQ